MRHFRSRVLGAWTLLCLLLTLTTQTVCIAQAPQATRFEVRLDPNVASEPLDGRLFIFFSEKSRSAPRPSIDWFTPQPFLAMDVNDFGPGEMRIIDERAIGFPDRLLTLPDGQYYIHALLAHSHYDGDPGRGTGNLYCQPVFQEIHPREPVAIELTLNLKVPEKQPRLQPWMELIEVPCPMLGEFHGREHLEPALVLLPPSYSGFSERRYPVMYCIPSFNVTHLDIRHCLQLTGPMQATGTEVEFIRVILNGQGPWGHHSYANSQTNGPRADSLVQELVPYIDEHYRTVAAPTARFLTGHSSGGWSSLWLQIQHPHMFGGVWSSAPDPVDFHSYQGVNIYAHPLENVYVTADGQRRRFSRDFRNSCLYWDSFARMDDAYGRGGQLRAFEAVFSPLDANGQPTRVFDRETGLIHPDVAEKWKDYDIRHVLQSNWEILKPQLDGKIHLLVGDQDTFFLNEAVDCLLQAIPDFEDIAEVEILEGRTHMNTLTEQRSRKLRKQLSESFLEHHHEAYSRSSTQVAATPQAATVTFVQNRIRSSNGTLLDLRQSDDSRTQFGVPYSVTDSDMADIAQMRELCILLMPGASELSGQALRELSGLSHLVELDLNQTNLTDASAPLLATFRKLEKLAVAGTKLGDAALADLSALESLQELNLRNTRVTSDGLRCLHKLGNLRILDVSGTSIERAGFELLSECKTLRVLRVQATCLDEHDIQPLLEHPSLEELDVSGTLLSLAEVERIQDQLDSRGSQLKLIQSYSPFTVDKTLPGSPVVLARFSVYQSAGAFSDDNIPALIKHTGLVDLDLRGTQISDAGLVKLLGVLPWHDSLRKLSLQGLATSGDTVESLANFRELADLNLSGIAVRDATDALANLSRLQRLNLQDCDVTDLAVAKLQANERLDYLALTNCKQVSDRCLPYLLNLRGLRNLYVRGTSISAEGIQALKQGLPACTVYGDPRKWEYQWPNPRADVPTRTHIGTLPTPLSSTRAGRVLIDSSRCDPSWWMGQQPERFDASRDYHAKSSLNMLRQQGYEVDLVKPGEQIASDKLGAYDVIIRQRPWLESDQDTTADYVHAVELGSKLILEVSPVYIKDRLAERLGVLPNSSQRVKSITSFVDAQLGRALQDHFGPFCIVQTASPDSRSLAWLDESRQEAVAGIMKLGNGCIYYVGGPMIDADRPGPLVQTIGSLLAASANVDVTLDVVAGHGSSGPRIAAMDSPQANEILPQPTSGYWQFQCTPQNGVQTSQIIVHGPAAVTPRSRETDFRDREHVHNLSLSYLREIPSAQAGRWFWQARARSVAGEWGPWSEPRAIRVAPTAAEAAALLPPQPEAPESVPGMHVLSTTGSQPQFLGENSFLALSHLGKQHVFYLDPAGPKLVTDQLFAYGFGSGPYIFGNGSWLIHLQPKPNQETVTAFAPNRNIAKQPLLLKLDKHGHVTHQFSFEHSASVVSRYIALGRWLVTRSEQDNRLWDLTLDDPSKNFITIDAPQNQGKMDPFRIAGQWMLAGDQLLDLNTDEPLASARQLPADASAQAYFSNNRHWLVKGQVLVNLKAQDWTSAIHVLPAVSTSASVTFSGDEKWLLHGPFLIDLTASSPAESALRLGIDDRANTLRFGPDNRWLFATGPAKIQVWDLNAANISDSMREAQGPGGGGYGFAPANAANIAFSPDHRWATLTSYAGKTLIFDMNVEELKPYAALENQNSYMSLNWSRDSRWLFSGNSDRVQITDLNAPAPDSSTQTIAEVGTSGVRGLATVKSSPNQRWLCFTRHRRFNSSNPPIKLWDLESSDPRHSELELPVPLGFNGSFSLDSRFLAIPSLRTPGTGGNNQSPEDLVLFDLTAVDIPGSLRRLPTHQSSIRETMFSSDGRWLVTSDMKQARVFDLHTLVTGSVPTTD